jgi:hypothetical protein
LEITVLRTGLLILALILGSMSDDADAEVWRCKEGDRVVFSDQPCPKSGRQLDDRALNANVLPSEGARRALEATAPRPMAIGRDNYAEAPGGNVGRPDIPPSNECPGDQEIRNLEVKASSITLGRREKDFLADEVRRARQCRKGQGNYSASDWQASREAQNAQSNNTNREAARRRAEGVHSAADPVEGNRIATARAQEEAARAFAIAERRRRDEEDARFRASAQISHCSPGGCYTSDGKYYQRGGGGQFYSSRGLCRIVGSAMRCPQ